MGIAPRALSISSCLLCGILLDELADAIAPFAGALGAFDAEHIELTLNVTEDEISALRHDCAGTTP
jgi:hypothetical protein